MSAPSRAVLLFLLALLAVPSVLAQEQPLAEEPAAKKELTGDQKVYVPFRNLKDVFEKEGQGVFVPFEEFLKLWEADLDRRPVAAEPPMPFLITRAIYEGSVDGDVATVKAVVSFETFTPGWSAVPLGFSGISFAKATIGGEAATLEGGSDGYWVHVLKPGAYELSLEFVTPVVKAEDLRTVSFRMPPAPVSRLVFDVPEEGAKVTVEPNLATTRTEPGSGITRVMAYVGAAQALSISWKPRPAETVKGASLVFADSVLNVSVEETVVRVRADIALSIHRAPADTFRFVLEPAGSVLFVEGNDLRQWDFDEPTRTITVTLLKPAETGCRLAVTLEVPRPANGTVRVPAVKVDGASRDQGLVLLRAPDTVKVLPETALPRVDFDSLPAGTVLDQLLFAWRWPAHPFALTLAVTRVDPVIDVVVRTLVDLDERRLLVTDQVTFTVTRAGIFEARIGLPEGLTVTDVSRDVVDDWRVLPDRTLVLDLKGRRLGPVAVTLVSTRESVVGDAPVNVDLPFLSFPGVRRIEGTIGVRREEGLKVETGEMTVCEPLDAAGFGDGASIAFSFRAAGPRVALTVSRREPEVSAEVVTELRAEQNRIAVKAKIRYTVRYAGVDSFSFTLPADLKEKVRVTGNNIREQPKSDLDGGLFRQKIVLQGKVLGDYLVEAEYDLPYSSVLKTGDLVVTAIPTLAVENAVRDQGFYAVWRDPALEIDAITDNVEPVDPRELPAGVEKADVFLAFKWLTRPHGLELSIVKHDVLPVLAAVIHHQHIVTVLNEEGTARTELVLALTNNGLQFLTLALPDGARPETLELWIPDGSGRYTSRKETPQAGAGGTILVRMPAGVGPESRFYVKLTWARTGKVGGLLFHSFRFEAPRVEDGKVPVLGTTWFVYPPPDVKVTAAGGTLAWLERETTWWSRIVAAFPEVFGARGLSVRQTASAPGAGLPKGISELAPAAQSRVAFGGRSRGPAVEIAYAAPGAFTTFLAFLFLLWPAVGVFLLRKRCRASKTAFVTLGIAVPLLFIPLGAPGTAEALHAVLLGALLCGAIFLALGACGFLCRKPAAPPAAKEC
jgi:hypothetical protein